MRATAEAEGMWRTFRPGTPSNRILRVVLALLASAVTAWSFIQLVGSGSLGVDLAIPLRAAERFASGGEPYLASAFSAPPGPDLPFLYPPYVLPFLVPLQALTRWPVEIAWLAICTATGAFSCRRLGIPPLAWPLVLAWPPFAEAIVNGNVQVVMFAAFVGLFYAPRGTDRRRSRDRDLAAGGTLRTGLLAVGVAALKPSEGYAWLFTLRRRPRAALIGAGALLLVALLTLPLTGLGLWFDWLAQAQRAGDPSWPYIGAPLSVFVPRFVALAVTAACLVGSVLVPRRHAGAWLGVLSVIGAPSLHMFELVFLVPAMLRIRRELAMVAAAFVATYSVPGIWLGIAIVSLAMLAGERVRGLLEQPPPVGPAAPATEWRPAPRMP